MLTTLRMPNALAFRMGTLIVMPLSRILRLECDPYAIENHFQQTARRRRVSGVHRLFTLTYAQRSPPAGFGCRNRSLSVEEWVERTEGSVHGLSSADYMYF